MAGSGRPRGRPDNPRPVKRSTCQSHEGAVHQWVLRRNSKQFRACRPGWTPFPTAAKTVTGARENPPIANFSASLAQLLGDKGIRGNPRQQRGPRPGLDTAHPVDDAPEERGIVLGAQV